MKSEKSILLISPYFGKWPEWFHFFLKSCEFNPSINWLFFTDCDIPKKHPSNVTFKKTTYADYNKLVSEKLDINFNHDRPYKLCDLKPAYGYIHSEQLIGYDFWGFCDIDVIFGNLRNFLTPDVLKHDVITSHERRIAGHFTIFRNKPEIRSAFMQCKNWRDILENKENQRFDEKGFTKLFIRHKNLPILLQKARQKLSKLSSNIYFREQFSTPNCSIPWVDDSQNFPTEWYWNNGELTNNASSREFMYFHFLGWKYKWQHKEITPSFALPEVLPNQWIMRKDGFSF